MDLTETNLMLANQIERHPWEIARAEVIFSMISDMLSAITERPVRILDVGCGDTFIADYLSKLVPKAEFFIVDPAFSDENLNMLTEKYKNRSIKAYRTIEEVYFENREHIDLVLLLDVIEHVEDDQRFLTSLRNMRAISMDTKFLITTPAFRSLFTQHDVFLKHFRRYSLRLLKKKLHDSGFYLHRSGYFFTTLLPFRAGKKISEILFGHNQRAEKGTGAWKTIPIVDRLIIKTLLVDYKISRQMRKIGVVFPGLSAFAVCTLVLKK